MHFLYIILVKLIVLMHVLVMKTSQASIVPSPYSTMDFHLTDFNKPHNDPFHDAYFWRAVERLLIHIRPEVITEDGIEMPIESIDDRRLSNNKPKLHGYMHLVYKDTEDQILSGQHDSSTGRTVVGMEPVKEFIDRESKTITLQFNLNSNKVDINDVYRIELAFSCPNEISDSVGDEMTDIEINNGQPLKLPIKILQHEKCNYHTMEVPWHVLHRWRKQQLRHKLSPLIIQISRTAQMERPLLVLYAKFNQTRAQAEHPVRRVRSAHLPPRTCKRCAYAERKRPLGLSTSGGSSSSSSSLSTTSISKSNHHDMCGLRQWYVTIGELRWDSWVIAPSGFPFGTCIGPCQAPIIDVLYNATNHAVVRSMLLAGQATDKMTDIPPPYCVPIKLRSTNIMYQESGQFFIKNLENIIVEQCGCS